MADAVEAVSRHALFVPLVGNRVNLRAHGEGGVKGRIEDRHLRRGRPEHALRHFDRLQFQAVMFRGEFHVLANLFLHLWRDAGGGLKGMAAVDHAVTHHVDFARPPDRLRRAAPKGCQDGFQHGGRRLDIHLGIGTDFAGGAYANLRFPRLASPVGLRFPERRRGRGGQVAVQFAQGRLERARSTVQSQYLHKAAARLWCPGRELNPHSRCREEDFKSSASADFATRAETEWGRRFRLPLPTRHSPVYRR